MSEQPMPTPSHGVAIADLVIADIQERKRIGIGRYRIALQAHNGRDALQDAYEESIDQTKYLKQALVERADHRAEGAADERAAAVAHLNGLAERASSADARAIYMNVAAEIERGKHRSPK